MSSFYSSNSFLSARETQRLRSTQTFQTGGPRKSPRPYSSLSWHRMSHRKTKRPQTTQLRMTNKENTRPFFLQKTPRASSSGLLSERQIRFEDNSDSDSGVSEVDKSTDVYFSDVFSHLDSEIESSRCRTRSEFISQVSQDHMMKSLQKPSSVVNKAQSVTAASSRRSSASQHETRERSTSIIEVVRGRVVENQGMFQTRSPSARPSSAASFMSTNDDYFDFDAQMSSRSSRQFPYMATGRSVVSSSYLKQDPTFGSMKKGATEGVKACKRMESVLNEDLGAVVNDLARQCCDVLGPSICKECTKNTKRFNNLLIFHRKHPDIDETAMTLYAIPLIQRMYPELGKSEVKAKLASGEIGQQIKIKINRSKDIENFDEKVTDYFPEKYRRHRMRRQRIEAGAPGVTKMEDDVIHVEAFNPGNFLLPADYDPYQKDDIRSYVL